MEYENEWTLDNGDERDYERRRAQSRREYERRRAQRAHERRMRRVQMAVSVTVSIILGVAAAICVYTVL